MVIKTKNTVRNSHDYRIMLAIFHQCVFYCFTDRVHVLDCIKTTVRDTKEIGSNIHLCFNDIRRSLQ